MGTRADLCTGQPDKVLTLKSIRGAVSQYVLTLLPQTLLLLECVCV